MNRVTTQEILEKFDSLADSSTELIHFTASARLQREKVAELRDFLKAIKSFKSQARTAGDEQNSNLFLHIQCLLNFLISVLQVWLHIKDEDNQEAWSSLVDAQEYLDYARKIEDRANLQKLSDFLVSMEDVVFPKFLFNSIGCISDIGKCSICGEEFLECDHIENVVYNGSFCKRIEVTLEEFDHNALVEVPADRRCIFPEVLKDGKKIDAFTKEFICDGEPGSGGDSLSPILKGIIFNARSLDIF